MNFQSSVVVKNKLGLHVRPATSFAETARRFRSAVQVVKDGETVNGKSPIDLLTLAAIVGTPLTILAEGEDAQAAVEALCKLVDSGFGEEI